MYSSSLKDEELAKRLQDLELSESRNNNFSNDNRLIEQTRKDEELARQLSLQPEDSMTHYQNNSNTTNSQIMLFHGETAQVRLHHHMTKSIIGEYFNTSYIDQNSLIFELVISH
jgi:uncharacterized protein YbcC (UPF0753/DUF2309 family)